MKRRIESISLSVTLLLFALTLGRLYFKEIDASGYLTPWAVYLMVHGAISILLFCVFSLSILIPAIAAKYEEWFTHPPRSSRKKWIGFGVFLTLWIAIFINFIAGFVPIINELPPYLRPAAGYLAAGWPIYVALVLAGSLIENRWRTFSSLWRMLSGTKPARLGALIAKVQFLERASCFRKRLANWGSRILRSLSSSVALGIAGLAVFIGAIVFGVVWIADRYQSGEFFSEFSANVLSALIGVGIGAIVAILVTIFVVSPLGKRKEEKRLGPLRRPILMFWDHTLALYTTSIFMELDFPQEIGRAISDISLQVALGMDSLADEQKLIEIEKLLLESDIQEEVVVRSLVSYKETLREYKDFLLRMHETVVALPYLFKETPEIASGIETLVGNFLSGLKMMEFKTDVQNNVKTTRLNFYSTGIIKMTGSEAFALIREIRRARLKHQ